MTFVALRVEELAETAPREVPWIAPGLVARGCVTMLAGEGGLGKSLIAMSVAKGVSEGGEACGFDCRPGRVMYVDAENGEDELHRRVHALGLERNVTFWLAERIQSNYAALADAAASFGTTFVVLDSFRSLWPEVDENDSKDVSRVLVELQQFARLADVGVLFLHHTRKDGGFRGSGAFQNVPEVVVQLGRHPRDKIKERRRLFWTKCRVGPQPPVRWLTFRTNGLGLRIDPCDNPHHSELWDS